MALGLGDAAGAGCTHGLCVADECLQLLHLLCVHLYVKHLLREHKVVRATSHHVCSG